MFVFVLLFFVSILVFNHLEEEQKAGCSVTLPHDAVGWSAVCDCGIS